MKKSLIVAFAICILLLVGCGTVNGTGSPSSAPAPHTISTVTTTSPQDQCRVLQANQSSLSRQIQKVSAQLFAAAKDGNQNAIKQAEQLLIRLHRLLAQVQAGLKACPATH